MILAYLGALCVRPAPGKVGSQHLLSTPSGNRVHTDLSAAPKGRNRRIWRWQQLRRRRAIVSPAALLEAEAAGLPATAILPLNCDEPQCAVMATSRHCHQRACQAFGHRYRLPLTQARRRPTQPAGVPAEEPRSRVFHQLQ